MTMRVVAAALLLFLNAPIRLTAACMPPPPTCEVLATADVVFYGEAIARTIYAEMNEQGKPIAQGIQAMTFKVITAHKGVNVDEFSGLFYYGSEAAGFAPGRQYLVFAHRRVTGAFVTGCTGTLDGWDKEAVRKVTLELNACPKKL